MYGISIHFKKSEYAQQQHKNQWNNALIAAVHLLVTAYIAYCELDYTLLPELF